MIIRRAEPKDAESGAACHLACWREAYAELIEPQRLAALTAGPDEEPGVGPAFQLRVLNIRRAYWGTGVAQRQYNDGVGDRDAYLWVLRDNDRARGFYARNGFVPDGATKIDPDFGAPVIRMVREI